MIEEDPLEEEPKYRIKLLRCRRTNELVSPADHTDCRYCFGTEQQIEQGGDYSRFCDYRSGVDPEGAEHPAEAGRYLHG
jgi:hypothetical protein